jgi:hypothetical protein
MNFIEYIIADIVGVVTALFLYDYLSEVEWEKLFKKMKRSWKKVYKKKKKIKPLKESKI